MLSSKALTGQSGMGVMYELDAIAMAVIGGTSLAGGRGSVLGTCIGALIFGVIISGFTFMKLDAFYQEMAKDAKPEVACCANGSVGAQERSSEEAQESIRD